VNSLRAPACASLSLTVCVCKTELSASPFSLCGHGLYLTALVRMGRVAAPLSLCVSLRAHRHTWVSERGRLTLVLADDASALISTCMFSWRSFLYTSLPCLCLRHTHTHRETDEEGPCAQAPRCMQRTHGMFSLSYTHDESRCFLSLSLSLSRDGGVPPTPSLRLS
jgi:hypothetical protein